MADSFDLAIHLGPGVTSIPKSLQEENDQESDSDPNKAEVRCSCRLFCGIFMSIFIVFSVTVILILYLLCELSYQKEEKCYLKEHRMPNHTLSMSESQPPL
eukprot:02948.XXX_2026_2328_1 [CDS] Oithona nana genome sequencing.